MTGRITARQFHEAAGVGDWRVLGVLVTDESAPSWWTPGRCGGQRARRVSLAKHGLRHL